MNKVIVIVGPTAVGKTKISIEIAKRYGLEIISGDSVAVYKELNIGSAKPTKEEMAGVTHHLIDVLDPQEQYNVALFQREARKIMNKNPLSIICGGTGLYIQSALFNYEFEASKRDSSFELQYKDYSNEELYSLLLERQPNIDKDKLHPNNRKRVLRALEVSFELNKSIHNYNGKNEPLYDYYIVYLSMDRNQLYERINLRVDEMIKAGLIDEVKALASKGIYPHAIGYQELLPYINGDISLVSAIDEIKKNTRHLAKRQETWFNNQMDSHFYNVDVNNISDTINKIINDLDRWLEK